MFRALTLNTPFPFYHFALDPRTHAAPPSFPSFANHSPSLFGFSLMTRWHRWHRSFGFCDSGYGDSHVLKAETSAPVFRFRCPRVQRNLFGCAFSAVCHSLVTFMRADPKLYGTGTKEPVPHPFRLTSFRSVTHETTRKGTSGPGEGVRRATRRHSARRAEVARPGGSALEPISRRARGCRNDPGRLGRAGRSVNSTRVVG